MVNHVAIDLARIDLMDAAASLEIALELDVPCFWENINSAPEIMSFWDSIYISHHLRGGLLFPQPQPAGATYGIGPRTSKWPEGPP